MNTGRFHVSGALVAILMVCAAAAFPARAATTPSALEPRPVARAQTIRMQLVARYRAMPAGRGLAVTEATSTGVVEPCTLLTPDQLGARFARASRRRGQIRAPARTEGMTTRSLNLLSSRREPSPRLSPNEADSN
jgi:hypothetical protein